MDWAQRNGYAPTQQGGSSSGRRLDAYDDRMDSYKAKADYWKA